MTTLYGESLARRMAALIIAKNKLTGPPRTDAELERYYRLVRAELARKAGHTLRTIANAKNDHATYWELANQALPVVVEEMRKIFMDEGE